MANKTLEEKLLEMSNYKWDGSLDAFGRQLICNLENANHCSIEFCENEFSVEQINIIIKTLLEMVDGKIDNEPLDGEIQHTREST